jgi:polyphosphate kinase
MEPLNPEHYINRDLSWLDFNFRVLAEAENEEVPLLERLKFIAIASSNLDEFFMVRVAMNHRAEEEKSGSLGPDGLTPTQTLAQISVKTRNLVARQYACLHEKILPELAANGIRLTRRNDFTADDRGFLRQFFDEQIMPVLTPMAVDTGHPFPLLANGAVYIMFRISPINSGAENGNLPRRSTGILPVDSRFFRKASKVLVQIPLGLSRFVRLPGDKASYRIALMEDIITMFAEHLLGGYQIDFAYPFRVTRDADFTVDDERVDDLMQAIEKELRTRRKGMPVRLEIEEEMPAEVAEELRHDLGLEERDIYRIPSILNLKRFFAFTGLIDRPDLSDEKWPPQMHPLLVNGTDIFSVMREHDFILHHPYQSFDPVVELIDKAADDPKVLAIKITLYRVSGGSPLVQALVRAAENGKQVAVLVELRARFDEEANIAWAKRLDDAGAHVIYGVVGYKTHSKVALIVRQDDDGIRRYVHLSTGNYNDRTARLYTDLGLFTTRPEIGADISAFFNVITGYSLPPKWNLIEMAPTNLRNRVLALIQREIDKHTPETPSFIRAKMNSLIDPEVIEALYRASQAGVRIVLMIRGMCRLRAGVPGLSENITVRSILDRFLEHPRIFHYRNGGQEEVYLSSADWMERNFDRRLELFFPVLSPETKAVALAILEAAFADNSKAWEMLPDGSYRRVARGRKVVRSQEELYKLSRKSASQQRRALKTGIFRAKTSEP